MAWLDILEILQKLQALMEILCKTINIELDQSVTIYECIHYILRGYSYLFQ